MVENKTQEQIEQEEQERKERRIERETENFYSQIIPFGERTISFAVAIAIDVGKDGDWVGEQITDYMEETDSKLDDIDPVAVVFESLLQEARNDIDDLTGVDILNDTENQVEVYGNDVCTSIDYDEEAQKELAKIMSKIDKEDFTEVMTWLWNEANLDGVNVNEDEEKEDEE